MGLEPSSSGCGDAGRGELICTCGGGHERLRSGREFADFTLAAEWRLTLRSPDEKRYNSGIGVRLSRCGEIWTQAQTGLAGGEWNRYEITARGDRVSLAIDGSPIGERAGAGLRRGCIGLEAEGYEMTFRKLLVRPLD